MLPIVALSFESHESESVQQIYSLDPSIEYQKRLHGGSEHYDLVHWHNLHFKCVWISIWIGCLLMKEVPTQPCGLTVCAFKIQLVEATCELLREICGFGCYHWEYYTSQFTSLRRVTGDSGIIMLMGWVSQAMYIYSNT